MSVKAEKFDGLYQPPTGFPCWHGASEAADLLGVSVSTVRKVVRAAGVRKVSGRTVAGMVKLYVETADGVTRAGYMPYAD